MRKILKYTSLTSLTVAAFLLGGNYVNTVSADAKSADYKSLERFSQVLDIVEQHYVDEVEQKELIDGALKGMLEGLDPHSTMMDKEEFKAMHEANTGKFSGIGIEITSENGLVLVVSPIEDTPADRAGIKSGDKILAVDGTYTDKITLTEAVNKMRGKKGTKVKLLVLHKGESKPVTLDIVRDDIPYITVKSEELEKGYHWVRLTRFSENSTEEMEKAFEKAKKAGPIKGIILDLRNNPGGLVDQAINVADFFLDSGTIMSMRGRSNGADEQVYKASESRDDLTAPVVVLVNSGSASASEIVAGALRDQHRALIVGEQTFGKGSVQNVIPLPDGTGLKLTVALYYTPSGKSIQAEGIVPDFEVPFEPSKEKKEDDLFIREKDLTKHLEVGENGEVNQEQVVRSKEAEEMLRLDNQLRMALQFVKSVPVMQNLK